MKPNLPNWLFLGGVGALAVSNTCKELLPNTLGRVFALHWGCAIVSAVFFSIGLFLSLRGLFAGQTQSWRFLMPLYCNLVFPVGLLVLYFMGFVVMSRIYQFSTTNLFPDLLPKLVDESQTAPSAEKRLKAAQIAYQMFGAKLAYRADAGNFIIYAPSPKDETTFAKEKALESQNQTVLRQLKSAMDQYPYLFCFYLGALFLTFLVGPLFFAFLRPRLVPVRQI